MGLSPERSFRERPRKWVNVLVRPRMYTMLTATPFQRQGYIMADPALTERCLKKIFENDI